MWDKVFCPKCKTGNWVNYGDPNDITGVDVDSVECYNCDHWFWAGDEDTMKDIYWSELEDGKTLDELLPDSFCERGRKNPDDPYEAVKGKKKRKRKS